MFQVEADKSRNLLVMIFADRVVPAELAAAADKVRSLLEGLTPGFRLLTDMSRLGWMDPACVDNIQTNMDLLNQHGIAKVVRVIPDPKKDIGMNILSVFHYRRGVQITTCETMAEAANLLANLSHG